MPAGDDAVDAGGYAAVRLALLALVERFRRPLRLAPRWRVEVSKGLWVEAGLS